MIFSRFQYFHSFFFFFTIKTSGAHFSRKVIFVLLWHLKTNDNFWYYRLLCLCESAIRINIVSPHVTYCVMGWKLIKMSFLFWLTKSKAGSIPPPPTYVHSKKKNTHTKKTLERGHSYLNSSLQLHFLCLFTKTINWLVPGVTLAWSEMLALFFSFRDPFFFNMSEKRDYSGQIWETKVCIQRNFCCSLFVDKSMCHIFCWALESSFLVSTNP